MGTATLSIPVIPPLQSPPSITTPDKVETRLGTLDFKDGMPSPATLGKVYYDLDLTHAVNAFLDTMRV